MILTKPKLLYMDEIDHDDVLRRIERAAKNCYQSKLKDDIADIGKFVQGLVKRGHETPLEFVSVTVNLRTSRSVLAELTRHRHASFCLSGDTEIKGFDDKKWTIEQLYSYKSIPKTKERLKTLKIRSVDENTHTIIPNGIVDIVFNGEKEVYELALESGRKLKCTANHEIFTPSGYKKLSDLKVGEYVYSNGVPCLENSDWLYQNYVVLLRSTKEIAEELGCQPYDVAYRLRKYKIKRPYDPRYKKTEKLYLLEDREWLYHNYIELNRQRKDIAAEIGCCESIVNKAFRKWGIRKEKSKYPNRQPGGGRGWYDVSEEGRARIIAAHSGPNSNWWKPDRSTIGEVRSRDEARKKLEEERKNGDCAFCGTNASKCSFGALHVHHLDGNPHNNSEENLILLCPKCHSIYHHTWAMGVFKDRIVSITPVGVEKVYDIEMEPPYHNFVANGIIVHNCVSSQRYCKETSRYGTTFVIPTHLSESEPDLTEGYYEIAMVPIQGPAGQMGVGMQIATASLSEDEKLGLARQIKCSETTGMFLSALVTAEQTYGALLQSGWSAQDAREILPNDTATDIAVCANLREWRHIFKLRVLGTTGKPYPPCREAVKLVYDKMLEVLPEVFGDLAELAPAEEEKKPEPPKKKSSILLGV